MVALFWRLVSRFPASGTTDVGSPALLAACGRVAPPLTSSTIFFNGCPVLRVLCEGRARCRWDQEIFVLWNPRKRERKNWSGREDLNSDPWSRTRFTQLGILLGLVAQWIEVL